MIDRTEIEKALRVFVKGFAEVRGRTWPYLQTRTGDLWRLHDAPRKTSRGYRREEWIGRNIDIRSADAAIRAGVISHFAVCSLLTESDSVESMKSGFRDMGYRQTGSEPLFVHRLKRVPRVTCPAEIRIMKTEADAALFAAATRTRQVDASVLRDAPYRQYLAFVGDELVGRVRSINTPEGQWCSDMFVEPRYRRRQIGRALLAQMLRDDRRGGADWNVLLASHAGAMLYPTLGYTQLGTLYIFVPKRYSA